VGACPLDRQTDRQNRQIDSCGMEVQSRRPVSMDLVNMSGRKPKNSLSVGRSLRFEHVESIAEI
jgi:hypothetical protein